ncbi:uncharacterized protein LOC128709072 [Anopheles marshallii]|uniref:uncharacterized protein LOC128709072 n=1 Tax=Anopheles marshallii TaxID=1521116 RepID=UPI00237A8FD8|nr:uncharacterized protein LOC128709072 [Anopheles marshallii]
MVSASEKKSKKANNSVRIEENWEPDVTVPPTISDDEENEPAQNVGQEPTLTKVTVAELCKQRAIPSVLEMRLQEYFEQHPRIQPLASSESNTVDIDLADSEEETWIIQCPSTINVKAELMAKKINLDAGHSTIKHCSVPLEAHVQINSEERVVGLLSGSRVKSFVPVGFVRINQALPLLDVPVPSNTDSSNQVTVPYPSEIRERHPLLGYDFNEHMTLPKRVRKRLSFAQQNAAFMYQNAGKSKKSNTTTEDTTVTSTDDANQSVVQSTPTKTKKRKHPSDVGVAVTVKQESVSPKRKKGKNDDEEQTVNGKKEQGIEDDISWLLNI